MFNWFSTKVPFSINGAGTLGDPPEKKEPWSLPHDIQKTQLEMD